MARRWVVKAGSKMVCDGGPLLMRTWMQQVLQLRRRFGLDVIWVTSGAIAWAVEKTGFSAPRRALPRKQALSAIGQPLIMDQYNLALHAEGLRGSQVLLTTGDMKDPKRRRNLQNTLNQLLLWKVVPILNENDAVATEEIRFGDNDSLASQVAVMMGAERLVLMTDVAGLYDRDPNRFANAELTRHCPKVTHHLLARTKVKSTSKVGTGGMYSKLLAARRAQKAGIITHFVRGDLHNGLLDIATGHAPGTQIGGRPAGAP
jgi:glutamate 5-kinase